MTSFSSTLSTILRTWRFAFYKKSPLVPSKNHPKILQSNWFRCSSSGRRKTHQNASVSSSKNCLPPPLSTGTIVTTIPAADWWSFHTPTYLGLNACHRCIYLHGGSAIVGPPSAALRASQDPRIAWLLTNCENSDGSISGSDRWNLPFYTPFNSSHFSASNATHHVDSIFTKFSPIICHHPWSPCLLVTISDLSIHFNVFIFSTHQYNWLNYYIQIIIFWFWNIFKSSTWHHLYSGYVVSLTIDSSRLLIYSYSTHQIDAKYNKISVFWWYGFLNE